MLTHVVLLLSVCVHTDTAGLRPIDVTEFWLEPDRPGVIRFACASTNSFIGATCTICDYWGNQVSQATLEKLDARTVSVTLKLPQGYYEVTLPDGQRFGLVVLEKPQEQDPFFCIDSAMSWLVSQGQLRDQLVAVLGRAGVAMSRERLSWAQVEPAKGHWEWQTPRGYEQLRRRYTACNVPVLEMFHDAPRWIEHRGRFPADLVHTAQSWQVLARRWQELWAAFEVWNEPDIFFSGNLPADQYVTLLRTFNWCFSQGGIDVPIVAGVFAHFDPLYQMTAAENQLPQLCDAVSFHTYAHAPAMEQLVQRYVEWLRKAHCTGKPLWITESGRPWRRGPGRPPVDQDAVSALDITMKAIEAKACGIARYFAFVYPYYEENENNFGMMGRSGTPLRSMAAYAQAIRALAGAVYVGDLAQVDPQVVRARVFRRAEEQLVVAVFYTGKPAPDVTVACDLPIQRLEGIDGRLLQIEKGRIPVPDGLVYAWLPADALASSIKTDTVAGRLRAVQTQNQGCVRQAVPPVVMRLEWNAAQLEPTTAGYKLRQIPETLRLRFAVFNLAVCPVRLSMRVANCPDGWSAGEVQTMELPALSQRQVDFALRTADRTVNPILLRVEATLEQNRQVVPYAMALIRSD